jgi:amino acid adenylation domain-containing protein
MSISSTIQDSYLQKEKDYWFGKLAGEIHPCGLPLDFRRAGSTSGAEQTLDFAPDRDVVEKIATVSRGNEALLFAILVGALKICLHKYTGMDDILVGSAIHERHKNAAFSNSVLVLRDWVEDGMSVRQLLDEIRHTLAEAYANQRYPFERLQQLLGSGGNRQPLFRVAVVLNTIHDPKNVLGLGEDLTLEFSGTEKELVARIHYDAGRLRPQTCEQFAGHYCQVLRTMLNFPDKAIAHIQLFSREQKQQWLQQRNGSRKEYPREATIPALFEEQARRSPDAMAVRYEGQSLSYQELNAAANQLAHYLRERGSGPEAAVGICIDRSLEMIVGLLGILKSGAAYVPVDPDYPLERQEIMVDDSGLQLLLVSSDRLGPLPAGVERVCLDQKRVEIEKQSKENPVSGVSAENLAYILYTSGSTGTPKGVAVPHRGVVRLVKQANYVELGREEKILQFAPLSFDASTFELWGSLLQGGELVVMSAGRPSLEALGAAIREHEISTMWLTAGLFHLMADHCLEDLQGVRQLLAGGDVVSVAHAKKYLKGNSRATLINGYGPTENTTFTCCFRLQEGTEMGSSVPIGLPISNTEVYIVDHNFDLVPIGVAGELYAGGDGLARGYTNAPELTAERFLPNPFSEVGERLYRTGDMARYRWDGSIEFVGRADQQVKIRGYRIEPTEIEAVLGQHESVRASVVLLEVNGDGEKQLTAYVVAPEELTKTELRKYLEGRLPEYMVPSKLEKIRELPLTENGKVDRARLAEQKTTFKDVEEENEYVAPRNDLEQAIAEMWRDILRLERVGVFDNFFDLGGHSLLAMKLCTKMSSQLMCPARVTDLFLHPTIDSLARHLGEKSARPVAQVS